MYAVRFACRYFVAAWGHIMGARMENRMRADLFDQYGSASRSRGTDRVKTGDMMSRVVSDLFDISEAAHHGPENIVISSIEIVGMLIIMSIINWQLALALTLVTAIAVVYLIRRNKTLQATFRDNRIKISGINSQLEDSLSGIRVVKLVRGRGLRARQVPHGQRGVPGLQGEHVPQHGRVQRRELHDLGHALHGGHRAGRLPGGGGAARGVRPRHLRPVHRHPETPPSKTLVNFTEVFQKAAAGFKRFCEILSMKPDIIDSLARPTSA